MSRITVRLFSLMIGAACLLALCNDANAFGHHRRGGGGCGGYGYGGGCGYGGCGGGYGYGGYGYGGGYAYSGYGYNPYAYAGYRYGGYYATPYSMPMSYGVPMAYAPARTAPATSRVTTSPLSANASATATANSPSPSDRTANLNVRTTNPTNQPAGTPNATTVTQSVTPVAPTPGNVENLPSAATVSGGVAP